MPYNNRDPHKTLLTQNVENVVFFRVCFSKFEYYNPNLMYGTLLIKSKNQFLVRM
jgi:hypothetical protein